MPCEDYREALIEAAAVDARLSPALRSHLDACAPCRAAFVEETQLFAAIDTGLRTAANAEVPPSFFSGVRASLPDDTASQRGWTPFLIFAAAAVAMVLTVLVTARLPHTINDNRAKQIFSAPPREKPEASTRGEARGTPAIVASSRSYRIQHQRNTAPASSPSSNAMDVLVPPEEREAFARFIGSQPGPSGVVIAVVAAAADNKDKRLSVEPLEIAELEVKPIEALRSELSDGTYEEQ
jgi:hypothetical protein